MAEEPVPSEPTNSDQVKIEDLKATTAKDSSDDKIKSPEAKPTTATKSSKTKKPKKTTKKPPTKKSKTPNKKIATKAKEPPKELLETDMSESEEAAAVPEVEGPPYPFIYDYSFESKLDCAITSYIEPEVLSVKPIKKSSNLLASPGSGSEAGGNVIKINGVVVDENCMPISGAVIQIWQTDQSGKYEHEYDSANKWDEPKLGKDINFAYSGTALTDNVGVFSFATIFPGVKDSHAPYINFLIKKRGFETVITRMYFKDHPANATDFIVNRMSNITKSQTIISGRSGKDDITIYQFPITLRGINGYKRY